MLSDEALYEQLLRGDLAAFDALYERYERHLFGFILRSLGDRQEAEDVLHDVFMALLREGKAGGALGCLRAWIFQVARNQCRTRLRTRQRARTAMDAVAQEPAAAPPEPERALEDRQAVDALLRAVARLPEPLAELYQLRAGGLSYEELAQVLDLPLGTVKSRMHEMVSRLREEVQP
jgi:RNA polymerase sigma-70 factor, ECF subfamily